MKKIKKKERKNVEETHKKALVVFQTIN